MPNNFFDDIVDDFLGGKAAPSQPVQTAPQAPSRHLPETSYTPETVEVYKDKCKKCVNGVWGYGRFARRCFACEGRGFFERKTSPQVRAVAAARRVEKKVATATENLEAFKSAQPEVFAWIEQTKSSFEFAASMHKAIVDFGDLTERQLAACVKCVVSHNARKAARQQAVVNAPAISVDKLLTAFETASKAGLKRPVMRFEGFSASLAPATGRNAGAVYIKSEGTYLGKVQGGKFLASFECTPAQKDLVAATMEDPLAQAVAYGKRTGSCSCCGRELTDPVSVANGIGPICAERFGL